VGCHTEGQALHHSRDRPRPTKLSNTCSLCRHAMALCQRSSSKRMLYQNCSIQLVHILEQTCTAAHAAAVELVPSAADLIIFVDRQDG
jgi:hypothetical protein